jgi:tRNA(Ile)-lysidine synthase TilS/MesJ
MWLPSVAGVDSVVLLDMLVRSGTSELVVAHFDHGIRPDSEADARFVRELAKRYDIRFETERG